MTEPFSISFIIPYYELGKDLLLRAIGSVLDLRLEYDWELIVVDDGSKRFPARQWVEACGDSRIRYVWKENGGLGPARNTGAELATKSYIQFLDADDYLLADGFRQAATLTEKERPDILYYRYKMTYGTGKESVQAEKQTFVERFSSGAEYMATRNLRGSSTQMLVRRHLVQTTPFVNIYFEDEHFSLDSVDEKDALSFVPAKAGVSAYYPVENGQIVTSKLWGNAFNKDAVPLSGMGEIQAVFSKLDPDMPFLELLSCEGGCINGPVGDKTVSLAERKSAVVKYTQARLASGEKLFEPDEDFVSLVLDKGYDLLKTAKKEVSPSFRKEFSEEEIARAMLELGKTSKEDELNCGGCGYNTCRDMAVAYLSGMAEAEMCVTKMRKEAQSKVDVLLRTIPNAIVIVNKDLNIDSCNLNFLRIFGDMDEALLDENMLTLVNGLPLERFVPFYQKFSDEFYAQKMNQYRLHYKDKFLRVTFFLVESGRLLGAMFEDITNPTVRRETVVKKAEDVIQKSLETVQQIASLLGENAAETEIMLNSLIDAFSVHDEGAGDGFTLDEDQMQ